MIWSKLCRGTSRRDIPRLNNSWLPWWNSASPSVTSTFQCSRLTPTSLCFLLPQCPALSVLSLRGESQASWKCSRRLGNIPPLSALLRSMKRMNQTAVRTKFALSLSTSKKTTPIASLIINRPRSSKSRSRVLRNTSFLNIWKNKDIKSVLKS